MRHPAPFLFLLTLLFLTQDRIIQFWQWVKAILLLSTYSRHVPTVIQSGGMNGGMKLPLDARRLSTQKLGV